MKPIISPSILSANFAYLANDIEMINGSEAGWVHIDIMDGVFVPNISFGFPVLKYVAKLAEKPLDVHLMIVQPEKFIPEVKALGARIMNVHYEACPHLHRVVQQILPDGTKLSRSERVDRDDNSRWMLINGDGAYMIIGNTAIKTDDNDFCLIMTDEITSEEHLRQRLTDEELAVAYIYVDNFAEMMQYDSENYRIAAARIDEVLRDCDD